VTYNSLPPTPCPSGIRAQIVSSLTILPKDDIKNGIYEIELPKLLGWKGLFGFLLFQLGIVNKHKLLLEP
jgi:hypothetical protein